jgi:protein TonB
MLRKQTSAAKPSRTAPSVSSQTPIAPGGSVSSLLKQKDRAAQQSTPPPQLFPGASRLAKLEENYRRAFENDIAEGDTRFLNSDDIAFGSFLRRFEGAVYGVWRYPQAAAMKGIEGITPVRITFNRQGEITHIQQLESSGALILDEEVMRTLRAIGPVGGFPKGYDKEEFHLIAFFQYGGSRRSLR